MSRPDQRTPDQLRPVVIRPDSMSHAEGSAWIEMGGTHVLCTASVEERVPGWLRGKGKGWVTAEYGMLPRATHDRTQREAARGKQTGRTQEIQRLIGRSLRAVTDLVALGERTIWVDCDVIRADGGTRTAAITGAYVAVAAAIEHLMKQGRIAANPLSDLLAAVSVGVVDGVPMLDLCYAEDSAAQVDMNVVMTGSGDVVEIQGTAEDAPFSRALLDQMLDLAETGIQQLNAVQRTHVSHLFT